MLNHCAQSVAKSIVCAHVLFFDGIFKTEKWGLFVMWHPQWSAMISDCGLLGWEVSAVMNGALSCSCIGCTEWCVSSMCFGEIHENIWWCIHDDIYHVRDIDVQGFWWGIDTGFAIVSDASWIMFDHCLIGAANSFWVKCLTHNLTIYNIETKAKPEQKRIQFNAKLHKDHHTHKQHSNIKQDLKFPSHFGQFAEQWNSNGTASI